MYERFFKLYASIIHKFNLYP